MPKFVVYTDGGCRGNGKSDAVGAWAFIVYDYQGKRIGSKSDWQIGCTNNQMEMAAVRQALSWANKHGYQIEFILTLTLLNKVVNLGFGLGLRKIGVSLMEK